jgi:putative NADPH-quinone reductase
MSASTLIIYCHPSSTKSHNAKILTAVKQGLGKKQFEVLDLYKLKFNPLVTEVEYNRMITRDRTISADVRNLQNKITAAKTLIFIYPVWWYNMPAMLKGFMDRVFTPGFAYNFKRVHPIFEYIASLLSYIPGLRYFLQPHSAIGHLSKKKALIFRTYGGPPFGNRIFGNTVTVLENDILRFCGITNITIRELHNVNKSSYSQKYEDQYLSEVSQLVKKA